MTTHWPRVDCRVERIFIASHALPQMGNPQQHEHVYKARFGYFHEINPESGAAKCSLQELHKQIDGVISRVEGKDLNEVLPVTPTAEWLACWLLANVGFTDTTSGFVWTYCVVEAYGSYRVRVDMSHISSHWLAVLRGTNARPA